MNGNGDKNKDSRGERLRQRKARRKNNDSDVKDSGGGRGEEEEGGDENESLSNHDDSLATSSTRKHRTRSAKNDVSTVVTNNTTSSYKGNGKSFLDNNNPTTVLDKYATTSSLLGSPSYKLLPPPSNRARSPQEDAKPAASLVDGTLSTKFSRGSVVDGIQTVGGCVFDDRDFDTNANNDLSKKVGTGITQDCYGDMLQMMKDHTSVGGMEAIQVEVTTPRLLRGRKQQLAFHEYLVDESRAVSTLERAPQPERKYYNHPRSLRTSLNGEHVEESGLGGNINPAVPCFIFCFKTNTLVKKVRSIGWRNSRKIYALEDESLTGAIGVHCSDGGTGKKAEIKITEDLCWERLRSCLPIRTLFKVIPFIDVDVFNATEVSPQGKELWNELSEKNKHIYDETMHNSNGEVEQYSTPSIMYET